MPHARAHSRARLRRIHLDSPVRRVVAGAVAALLAITIGGLAVAPAAFAADEPTGLLTISKTANGEEAITAAPGDEFDYTITVGCDDNDCLDAQLTDQLPPEFAGFQILGTSVNPSSQPSTVSYAGCTTVLTANCELTVLFQQELGAAKGINAGSTYQVVVNLKVPQDLPASWPSNGVPVTNTAGASSTTAASVSDTADVTVDIPISVDTAVGKNWQPSTQQFQPGVASAITLTSQNTSNVPADSLSVQDPTSATDGQATLGADNPFTVANFSGFGPVTLPAGADTVQVDAYVFDSGSGSYVWKPGSPRAPGDIQLPATVQPGDVAGLRFTYAADGGAAVLDPSGAAGSVVVNVTQRATQRDTGTSLINGASVTNIATGTVTVPGQTPVSKTAQAPYTIGALSIDVVASKSIAPGSIPAGTTATATIGAKNNSNGPVTTLALADTDYFTESLQFGGFTAPIAYPAGAIGASIAWQFSSGGPVTASFADGDTPAAPAATGGAHLTGFVITYIGQVESGAQTGATFLIAPTVDYVTEAEGSKAADNTVDVTGVNSAGTKSASKDAPLQVFYPDIDLSIDKKISPAGSVAPGTTVVAQLPTTTSSDSAFVNPDKIVVEDVYRTVPVNDFWNAFNPIAIAPTQVLAGSTLTIEYSTDGGTNWTTFHVVDATGGTQVYSANLPAGLTGQITGLRYTFEKADGFGQGTTVAPNTVFQARSDLRDGSGPTSVADAGPSQYENLADAHGEGKVTGLPNVLSPVVTDTANAAIESFSGIGTLMASKAWTTPDFGSDLTTLSSQSGATAGTLLGWGVTGTGYSQATISDPAGDPADASQTVFQAFDLKAIAPVTFAQDPLLRWDTVSSIELFNGSSWQAVTPPSGGWMGGSGFVGHVLSQSESDSTTGVRITVTPNDDSRQNSSDPLAPPVGSGVATSANNAPRHFGLVWQLRNVVRDASGNPAYPWVSATHGYNNADPATVVNTLDVAGIQNGTPVGPRTVSDNVSLLDQPPAVSVTKTVSKDTLVVPNPGDVPASGYPTTDFTVTTTNDSASRASYIRSTDPMPCTTATVLSCLSPAAGWSTDPYAAATYDPATNPFERLNLTGIGFSVNTAQVDTAHSMVTLWKRVGGVSSTTQVSIDVARTLSASELADVVGVSVLYQGTDPAADGGSIATGSNLVMTLNTQLRVSLRSDDATFVTPFTIDNETFVQGYDPVLFPSGAPSTPFKTAAKTVQLIEGQLGVTASKVFSPKTLLEKDRTNPVTVTLGATQGNATVPTNEVTIEDTDAAFWDEFELTALAAGDVTLPTGADRVRVDVQVNGTSDWIEGTSAATAALPSSVTDLSTITGIRFVFNRADKGLLSHTAIPGNWNATAVLHVALLDAVRSTGAAVPFPSTIDDTVGTTSHRYDDPSLYPDATASADDDIALSTGTYRLDVSKSPQGGIHSVTPGDPNTWTMTFKNTGTGFLTVPTLIDTLPTSLEWDGETPTFATSAGGTLGTNVTTSYDASSRQLTFGWPSGSQRMTPDETFTITVGIVLQPGLTANQRATNQMIVTTGQTLTACTNTSGNGQGTLPGVDPTQCGTTNFVQPTPGASLLTTKAVKGSRDGATNVSNPGGPCLADLEGYFKSPCAANTKVGGTDDWKLDAVNSGTVSYTKLTFVDPLPFPNDRLLATGTSRGSTYRPVFDGSFGLSFTAPPGTTTTWQVTTAADVCVGNGAGTAWPSDPTCATHPDASSWTDSTAFSGDWADVTGIRAVLDFAGTQAQVLAPGGAIQIHYHTVNAPATAADPDRAPIAVPVSNAIAWNQFGAVANLSGGGVLSRAPVKAGVVMTSGPLQVTKAVTGDGASFAPASFGATASCTVAGADVPMGSAGNLTLDASNNRTARIDGIPYGADCSVTENGADGSYGESSRQVLPASVTIEPATSADPVPAAQIVTITNSYDLTSLTVSKAVETEATVGTFGPFSYTAQCTTSDGKAVSLDPADAAFSLEDGGSHTIEHLPVGADCSVVESDTDHADSVQVSVNGASPVDDSDAAVTLTSGDNTAAYTNTYEAGTLSVTKTLAGDAAGDGTGDDPGPEEGYGQGPFTIHVECTYEGETLFDDDVVTPGNHTTPLEPVFPKGTICSVAETVDGGANEHTPDQPEIVIAGPDPTTQQTIGSTTVDVTNTFNKGSLDVTKVRDGEGADVYGAGPFEVQVTCTWVKDGETMTIPLVYKNGEDHGKLELTADNGYKGSVEGLIDGATCITVETVNGGASSTTYSPDGGAEHPNSGVVTLENGTGEVTITNTYDVGSLDIVKNRVGDGVEQFGTGPFTVQVECTWQKDGITTPIDLGDNAELQLTKDNDYKASIPGLIAGAHCDVTETDQGLATASEVDPVDGITILADGDQAGPATVTITNTFDVGQLSILKTVDKPAATVGDTLTYTITVTNIGQIDATDLTVTDDFPAALSIVSSDPPGKATKVGSLAWQIDSLPVGQFKTFHVTATVTSAGSVANEATVNTPDGPWVGVDAEHSCNDDVNGSCATTIVSEKPQLPGDDGLASTGLSVLSAIALGTGVLAAGLLFFAAARRRRRV